MKLAPILATAAALGLTGCGGDTPAANQAANSADAASDAPSTPSHNWMSHDADGYAYEGSLSDDEKKAGQAAPDVYVFRYLGVKNGVYSLESTDGGSTMVARCSNPCTIIKMQVGSGYYAAEKRMAFTPDSIIGAAFQDAFNGQMEVYGGADQDQPSAIADAANTASNDASATAPPSSNAMPN